MIAHQDGTADIDPFVRVPCEESATHRERDGVVIDAYGDVDVRRGGMFDG